MVIIDQLPAWLRLAGSAAYDRREPTVPVAHLEHDTLMPGRKDSGTPRTLSFVAADRAVTVSVTVERRTVSLAVIVTPPGAVAVDVRPLHGVVRRVWTDETGATSCAHVPPGPVSLFVDWSPASGGPLRTAWTLV